MWMVALVHVLSRWSHYLVGVSTIVMIVAEDALVWLAMWMMQVCI